ncbi:MAG: hypothetical protein HXS44_14480 [Theionarchaea archaeon]|nr:hypothetical protein [Theionarchaea archaeon]
MYPVQRKYRDSSYLKSVYEFTDALEERIPTFTRTLDEYFDAHFEVIIEEWQLLTDNELRDLEKRLDLLTEEIDRLYGGKSVLERRASTLQRELEELETGVVT